MNTRRLKLIDIENFFFLIYYGLITLSLISNQIEKRYLIYHNPIDKSKYRTLLYIIFITVFIIYAYYTYENIKDLNEYNNEETKRLTELSLVASILVLISGVIYLYIIYKDKNIDIEIAFS